jgi:leucyl aminopeptidase
MKLTVSNEPIDQLQVDAVVVGYFPDETPTGPLEELDQATSGAIARLLDADELTGKPSELTTLLAPHGVRANQIVLVGLGERDEFDRGGAFRAAAAAAKQLAGRERPRVALCLPACDTDELVESSVCGAVVGCQGQDLYRSEKRMFPFEEVQWCGGHETAVAAGQILGEAVNFTRQLVNQPAGDIYPAAFAEVVSEMAAAHGIDVEIWDEARLAEERCGALLGVGQGSSRPPRLVMLRYRGDKSRTPLALVGKGVTFDSGGLSLKPSDSMKTMKCDMAGAATVMGAIQAIARLELPVHVVAFAGLVENMVSGTSYKLGDVLHSRSGKTIEVLNTDAEGRLVLADVLDVAVQQDAAHIIDLATLTGACMVALGTDVAGLMTNDQDWCGQVAAAAEACGEPAWQLPMFAEYAEQIKSNVADIKNIGEGRWGGAITAAKFLEEFVQEKPWVHIDIAGPSFLDSSKPWLDAGATGAFVRTLVEVARRQAG